jgi:hypothetical protein
MFDFWCDQYNSPLTIDIHNTIDAQSNLVLKMYIKASLRRPP